jgi:hypothetical protein
LDWSKFGANLNPFEINLIRFENRIRHTVLPTPPVSAAPTASLRCPAMHPDADDRAPVAPRSTCQPRRPTSRRPRRSPLSRGNAPPRCSTPRQATPLSLSLSRSASMQHSPLRAPSPPLPVKTEPPPAGRASRIRPHRPGVLLAGFLPPEPLLRGALRAAPFLN